MIGALISLAAGCYALAKIGEDNNITIRNKQEARAKGEPFYTDYRGKYWATYTGEQCFFDICSPTHNGHDIMIGMKTKTIYKDFTQDRIDEQNREFARQGKQFCLKEYTEVHDRAQKQATWKSTYWLYDLQKGKPYKITYYINPYYPGRPYRKTYLKPDMGSMFNDLNTPEEYLTADEAEKWKP